jgi:hypothetical protein
MGDDGERYSLGFEGHARFGDWEQAETADKQGQSQSQSPGARKLVQKTRYGISNWKNEMQMKEGKAESTDRAREVLSRCWALALLPYGAECVRERERGREALSPDRDYYHSGA